MAGSEFPCTSCGSILRVSDPDPAGKLVRCPQCQKIFSAPPRVTPATEAAPVADEPSTQLTCTSCNASLKYRGILKPGKLVQCRKCTTIFAVPDERAPKRPHEVPVFRLAPPDPEPKPLVAIYACKDPMDITQMPHPEQDWLERQERYRTYMEKASHRAPPHYWPRLVIAGILMLASIIVATLAIQSLRRNVDDDPVSGEPYGQPRGEPVPIIRPPITPAEVRPPVDPPPDDPDAPPPGDRPPFIRRPSGDGG